MILSFQVPFDNSGGIIYVWMGKNCEEEAKQSAEDIGHDMSEREEGYSLQVVEEGEEPENFFWVGIGGKTDYEAVS